MERESNSMQAHCRSGCGFYGNPATDGLCSLCYKEALKKKNQPPNAGPTGGPTSFHSAPAPAPQAPAFASSVTLQPSSPSSLMDTAIPTIPVISSPPSDHSKDSEQSGAVGGGAVAGAATASSSGAESGGDLDDSHDGKDDKDAKTKKKNRCALCRKKVGLTGFECRCGGLYCAVHRYSDKHDCSFDYRELGAQEIRRNNPVVVGEKIQKI
ncbi:AN1-type zinc finger protein 6 [Nilaparvata lugens]|uniref:AN1-type zinc finger protein 6 n=1 Tax=Nilaparvata lugens TaxID=108931 RepID=UPI000B98713D|nr:AN1-type zinc finger protein 6 [Nilaparvata lugens]XP_022184659.1 AN1-type zinc finger protein 6 [Nilaparvata lugens]XP_022184660.1 AN1-type zinc finger protein 6 [Nilaparvata lugens]XP_039290730.1 AN1-type zinc finger protein 6 [Nilaparvata lugens]